MKNALPHPRMTQCYYPLTRDEQTRLRKIAKANGRSAAQEARRLVLAYVERVERMAAR